MNNIILLLIVLTVISVVILAISSFLNHVLKMNTLRLTQVSCIFLAVFGWLLLSTSVDVKTSKSSNDLYDPIYIDGDPYLVRIPTGGRSENSDYPLNLTDNEWDSIMSDIDGAGELLHAEKIPTICQESEGYLIKEISIRSGTPLSTLRGGRNDPNNWEAHICARITPQSHFYVGYRPVLVPLDPETLEIAPDQITDLEDGEIVTFGTLYMDGSAVPNPQNPQIDGDIREYSLGAELHIGDSDKDPNNLIHWVKWNGLLISDRCILANITYFELDRLCLVDGKMKMSEYVFGSQEKNRN